MGGWRGRRVTLGPAVDAAEGTDQSGKSRRCQMTVHVASCPRVQRARSHHARSSCLGRGVTLSAADRTVWPCVCGGMFAKRSDRNKLPCVLPLRTLTRTLLTGRDKHLYTHDAHANCVECEERKKRREKLAGNAKSDDFVGVKESFSTRLLSLGNITAFLHYDDGIQTFSTALKLFLKN